GEKQALVARGGTSEYSLESAGNKILWRFRRDGDGGERAIVRECRNATADRAVGQHGGLKQRRFFHALADRVGPRLAPPERRQHIDDALRNRQRQRRAIAFVRQRSKLPCSRRHAEIQHFTRRATAFGVHRQGFRVETFAGGKE